MSAGVGESMAPRSLGMGDRGGVAPVAEQSWGEREAAANEDESVLKADMARLERIFREQERLFEEEIGPMLRMQGSSASEENTPVYFTLTPSTQSGTPFPSTHTRHCASPLTTEARVPLSLSNVNATENEADASITSVLNSSKLSLDSSATPVAGSLFDLAEAEEAREVLSDRLSVLLRQTDEYAAALHRLRQENTSLRAELDRASRDNRRMNEKMRDTERMRDEALVRLKDAELIIAASNAVSANGTPSGITSIGANMAAFGVPVTMDDTTAGGPKLPIPSLSTTRNHTRSLPVSPKMGTPNNALYVTSPVVLAATAEAQAEEIQRLEQRLMEAKSRQARAEQIADDLAHVREVLMSEVDRERIERMHAEKARDAYSAAYEETLRHLNRWKDRKVAAPSTYTESEANEKTSQKESKAEGSEATHVDGSPETARRWGFATWGARWKTAPPAAPENHDEIPTTDH